MYQITAQFRSALRSPHRVLTKAEILRGGTVIQTLWIQDGSVTIDATAAIRRRCNVTLVDESGVLTPASAADLLTPFGNELRLYRGIRFSDGGEEYVPLGIFLMTSVQVNDDGPGVQINVEGYDRARKIEDAKFTAPSFIAANTNYARAIRDLILSRVPTITFSPADPALWYAQTTQVTPMMTFMEEVDPWETAREMATALGRELFFNANGDCVMPVVQDPATASIEWTYAEGEDAMILGSSNEWTREFTYNWIIVAGENSTNSIPYRGEAKDTDPASPTYVGGPMGAKPYFLLEKNVTSQTMADDASLGILRKVIGATELVAFTSMVNPAHEAGDVVSIVRAKSKINNLYVLDQITIPLAVGGEMTAVTRRQRKV